LNRRGYRIQDSRFKAQKKLLQSKDSRLPEIILESKGDGFKKQVSRLRKNFFNPTSSDSRFMFQG
jgi:hypothetical protein